MCAFRDTDDASSALSKKKLKSRDVNPLAAQSGWTVDWSCEITCVVLVSRVFFFIVETPSIFQE